MPSWVYEIINNASKECVYVGSSTNDYFCRRRCDHMKPHRMKTCQYPLYTYIKNNGGWECFTFNIIHERPDIDKNDLLILEKQEIENRKPICNKNRPITTVDERNADKRISTRRWRINNPDKVKEHIAKFHSTETYKQSIVNRCSTHIDCPCGGKYTAQNKTNHYKSNLHNKYLASL
jgi:GIY-YIG catalytic domain